MNCYTVKVKREGRDDEFIEVDADRVHWGDKRLYFYRKGGAENEECISVFADWAYFIEKKTAVC